MPGKNTVMLKSLIVAFAAIIVIAAAYVLLSGSGGTAPSTTTIASAAPTTAPTVSAQNFSTLNPPNVRGFSTSANTVNLTAVGGAPSGVNSGYLFSYANSSGSHMGITVLLYPNESGALSLYGSIHGTIENISGSVFTGLPAHYVGGVVASNISMIGSYSSRVFVAATLGTPPGMTVSQSSAISTMLGAINSTESEFG